MKAVTNTIDESEDKHESTYALLMRSEEKSRNLLELVIYPALIVVAMMAILQFALQPAELPRTEATIGISNTSGLHAQAADRHPAI
jgi:hypothetical protein